MKFTLSVDLDGDAFYENAGDELARILRCVADRVEGRKANQLRRQQAECDYNGNICCHFGEGTPTS